jgi:hypothetical protein
LILPVLCVRGVYRGSVFFSLVLILRIPAYLGIKGDHFFSDVRIFFGGCTTICITCPILREIECNKVVFNKFVLGLLQIDIIQSIFNKTNTNLLHTNLLHSISCKIGHAIQIVVHPFVRKTTAKKNHCLKKIGPP